MAAAKSPRKMPAFTEPSATTVNAFDRIMVGLSDVVRADAIRSHGAQTKKK